MITEVVTVEEDITLEDAFAILHERRVGSVVITDEVGHCRGIFTERDAIRSVATHTPLHAALREVMTRNVLRVRETASFAEAKQLYRIHGIRHLPVVDEHDHLVGLLSIRSVLDELLEL
jgi:CBS domain-containing protein